MNAFLIVVGGATVIGAQVVLYILGADAAVLSGTMSCVGGVAFGVGLGRVMASGVK